MFRGCALCGASLLLSFGFGCHASALHQESGATRAPAATVRASQPETRATPDGRAEPPTSLAPGAPSLAADRDRCVAPGSLFYRLPTGSCAPTGDVGECVMAPQSCPLSVSAVCGCDGETYPNECIANAFGVSLRSAGPCPGDTIPPIACRNRSQCQRFDVCILPESRLSAMPGRCVHRTGPCPTDRALVCSEHGDTYRNRCHAELVGARVAHEGPCQGSRGSEIVCGAQGMAECDPGTFCDFCGGSHGNGWCRPVPTACPPATDWVCGCDGRSYRNECLAHRNKVGVAHPDRCLPLPGQRRCLRAGCSGELCEEEGSGTSSPCVFEEWMTCFGASECRRQPNGQCGWTQTPELVRCLRERRRGY